MRSHTVRLYVAAATLAAFFVLWVVIAAKPWGSSNVSAASEVDPRLVALSRLERRLRHETALVKRAEAHRWSDYRRRLRRRQAQIVKAKQSYERQLAAARAAQAQIAAEQAAAAAASRSVTAATASSPSAGAKTITTYTVSRVQSAPVVTRAAAAPAPAPATRVVTLPPQVQVVTLPASSSASTHSASSHP